MLRQIGGHLVLSQRLRVALRHHARSKGAHLAVAEVVDEIVLACQDDRQERTKVPNMLELPIHTLLQFFTRLEERYFFGGIDTVSSETIQNHRVPTSSRRAERDQSFVPSSVRERLRSALLFLTQFIVIVSIDADQRSLQRMSQFF
jgi:hypothetical protein